MKKTKREKFDAARKDAFLDLLAKGIKRGSACKKVGISRMTFNRHYNKNKAFADAVLQADMDANELIEQAMFNSALKGNVTAQQVWLYNRDPERWQDKRNIELTGKNKGPIEIMDYEKALKNLTSEQIRSLDEIASKLTGSQSNPSSKA